jgi:hypothetical protein
MLLQLLLQIATATRTDANAHADLLAIMCWISFG